MWFKRIAIFFILFANILVLAHSIIPHHHHKGLVVSVATVNSSHNSHKSFNDHSSDNDDDADCALREEILVPGRSFRFATDQQNENSELNFLQGINNAIPVSINPIFYFPCSFSQIQYDLAQYLFLLNNSQGLRAPPLS